MIDHHQFRELVIQPSLNIIDMYSEDAEELLIFTCANESFGCTYLKQIKGPALGPYGCEEPTYIDTCKNKLYLNSINTDYSYIFTPLGRTVNSFLGWFYIHEIPPFKFLSTNLSYATIICRLDYSKEKEPLPSKNDEVAMFNYYKKYYNSYLGKATEKESIEKYHQFIRRK